MSRFSLLIIDPQNDFHLGGSLAVPGADDDVSRTVELIRKNLDKIDDIFVTLDSHHPDHIAHALFWTNAAGGEPTPFTRISSTEIEDGTWSPKDTTLKEYCIKYAKALEDKGRFMLTIWPTHCLIGSHGQKVTAPLQEALDEWSAAQKGGKYVRIVHKGMNNLTEMYSAIKAEVPLPEDPTTDTNMHFIHELKKADKLVVCGQALSHCVNYTTRDVVDNWGERKVEDIIVLRDASSAVPGCQEAADLFLFDMTAAGVIVTTCENITSALGPASPAAADGANVADGMEDSAAKSQAERDDSQEFFTPREQRAASKEIDHKGGDHDHKQDHGQENELDHRVHKHKHSTSSDEKKDERVKDEVEGEVSEEDKKIKPTRSMDTTSPTKWDSTLLCNCI